MKKAMFTHTISKPNEVSRYRYLAILIIVIIVIAAMNGGPSCFKVRRHHIRLQLLIIYTAIIIGLLLLMMKWHVKAIEKIENDHELSEEEKKQAVRRLDHWWTVAHFLFYFGLGIVMPNNWGLVIVLQVSWELFEDFMGYKLKRKQYIETDGKKMSDIIVNSSGYFFGQVVANRYALRAEGRIHGPRLRN